MPVTQRNYGDVESHDGLHFLRDELGCEQLGFSIIDVEAGRDGLEHDHADDGQEEVYFLVEGDATLRVEGETIALTPGEAVRVPPEATRHLTMDGASFLVIAGAP